MSPCSRPAGCGQLSDSVRLMTVLSVSTMHKTRETALHGRRLARLALILIGILNDVSGVRTEHQDGGALTLGPCWSDDGMVSDAWPDPSDSWTGCH
eukprot:scaffold33273_cov62-Phaeocystis_antarctica.AAC.9